MFVHRYGSLANVASQFQGCIWADEDRKQLRLSELEIKQGLLQVKDVLLQLYN